MHEARIAGLTLTVGQHTVMMKRTTKRRHIMETILQSRIIDNDGWPNPHSVAAAAGIAKRRRISQIVIMTHIKHRQRRH